MEKSVEGDVSTSFRAADSGGRNAARLCAWR